MHGLEGIKFDAVGWLEKRFSMVFRESFLISQLISYKINFCVIIEDI